jgi:hypothetical protein
MGTKEKPSAFDCHAKAEPDEPYFVLLARDVDGPLLVELWARLRERSNEGAHHNMDDGAKVAEARAIAADMRAWRLENRRPFGVPKGERR